MSYQLSKSLTAHVLLETWDAMEEVLGIASNTQLPLVSKRPQLTLTRAPSKGHAASIKVLKVSKSS